MNNCLVLLFHQAVESGSEEHSTTPYTSSVAPDNGGENTNLENLQRFNALLDINNLCPPLDSTADKTTASGNRNNKGVFFIMLHSFYVTLPHQYHSHFLYSLYVTLPHHYHSHFLLYLQCVLYFRLC